MDDNQEFNINHEYITRYIRRTIKGKDGLPGEIERYAKQHEVPIAPPETISFIEILLKSSQAKNVLEIGAAVGYSSICMSMCGCRVTTIERDEKMLSVLHENIKKSSFDITVLEGDALGILSDLEGEFDFIFVDAAKAQYLEFLPHCMRLLKIGGILYSDNILYKGMVATDELFRRRKITIIRRLRKYLDELCSRDDLDTTIVPVGDGGALSYKKM